MADPLCELVGLVLEIPADEIEDGVRRGSVSRWDSLRHLQLMAAVEDAFGISLTPREIRRVASVADLRELLRTRQVLR